MGKLRITEEIDIALFIDKLRVVIQVFNIGLSVFITQSNIR